MLTPTSSVQSVSGKIGVITLEKNDVGLSNVDNTSDVNSKTFYGRLYQNTSRKIIKTFSKSDQMVDTVFLRKNKIFYIRSAAAIRCLLYLKWYWKIFFPILWIIPLPLRDLIYKVIATYRHKFFEKPKVCTFKVD